jgi:putative ABC transport system permease protein
VAQFAGLFRKMRMEREMAAELESHFAMHIAENQASGMSEAEARREALLKFGSVEAAKEAVREGSTLVAVETTMQDIRYALRGLRRNPGFASAAIVSLGLGIGASVAIFTLADSLLLRPLPYRDPERLMMVWEANSRHKAPDRNVISPANYRDWKAQNTVFESMAAFMDGHSAFSDGSRVEELDEQFMSADLLPMLGVQAWRGRLFSDADDRPGERNTVLISYRLWQSWFGGDEGVVGRRVQVRSQPATIIGVMPPGFYFRNRDTDVWETMGLDPAFDYRKSAGRYMLCVGRLRAGVSRAQAQAQMTAIARRLEVEYPRFDTHWSVNVEPFREALVTEVRTSLLVLLGAVGLLLAVACANVANLLLARYTARRREISVRTAIGAGRGRVVRQLLTEGLSLGLAGGILGMVLARWAVAGVVALAPADLTRHLAVEIDLRVLLFAVGVSLATGVIFGLTPSLVSLREDMTRGLHEDSRSGIGRGGRARSVLVGAEVALSVMLLSGAGLLFRTLVGLQAVQPGLNAENALTFSVQIPPASYREPAQRVQFFQRAVESVGRLPGVASASAVSYLPFKGMAAGTGLTIAGRPPARPGEGPVTKVRTVMPGYFATMGIPLLKGRVFDSADNTLDSPYRFVVSQAFSDKYFPGEDAIGRQISVRMDDQNPFGEIVGVVGDVNEGAVDQEPSPTVYYVHAHLAYTGMVFVARTKGDPLALAGPVREAIRRIDGSLPVAQMRTMDAVVRETFARQRFSAMLLGGFSAVSLLLAAVGIYGVLAYSVTERTREIGVRVALGAEPRRIVTLVLRGGMLTVVSGASLGLGAALALSGLLRGLLFGIKPHDAVTFAAVPAVLIAVAALAAYVPARRASRMAPTEALRAE